MFDYPPEQTAKTDEAPEKVKTAVLSTTAQAKRRQAKKEKQADKLEKGDQILTETLQGKFVYVVDSLEIVQPEDTEVLDDQGDNRLTLIACHPKYSLSQRIIVHATLEGEAAPPIEGQAEAREKAAENRTGDAFDQTSTIDGGLTGKASDKTPALLWGLACAAVWLATWLVQTAIRRRSRANLDII